ncbi:unnamed protein product [Chrysoparadoxa australica]
MEEHAKVWSKGGPTLWQEGFISKKAREGEDFVITVKLAGNAGTATHRIPAAADGESESLKLRNVQGQAAVMEGAGVADLTKLTHLHEPTILYSLNERYKQNTIYTYTGPILLAVNPFKKVALYTDRILTSYKKDGERRMYDPNHVEQLAPHVYAIADKAYRNMTMPTTEYNLRSQSILVSGESGAGKTETCKIIMKYLAVLGNGNGDACHLGEVETQVLQSNPILEAFGNARTVRNDNSSRFGKYIQILFSDEGKLSGAAIKTFLLEKIRVVKQTKEERNYHIFYMLDAGASQDQKQRWEMGAIKDYHYTNQSNCYDRRDGVTDKELYAELMGAFATMGFTEQQQADSFDICATVLALGNVSFEAIPSALDDGPQAKITSASKKYLDIAAKLMGVKSDAFIECLISRQVTAGLNHQVTIYLTAEQANAARDAMAKAIYAGMFEWIVQRTNNCIDRGNEGAVSSGFNTDKTFIGLLDIFGFEIFKSNYYEQFLINYANEVLQQQFNDFVFRQEQEEYKREQIQWSFIEFPDNKDCIELIESKVYGIIPTLDEQCLIGKATDERFARELYKKCDKNRRFQLTPKMRADHAFCIVHYAGDVTYATQGIIEKNRDTLQQEGVDLLMSSSNPFIVLMGEMETRAGAQPAKKLIRKNTAVSGIAPGRRHTIGAKSLGTQFKDNLNNLLKVIQTTHPHYVRCIKPNDKLIAGKFDHARIAEQLRNAGVLEVIRVARAGFPVRLGIQEFIDRYGLLATQELEESYRRNCRENESDQERAVCTALITSLLRTIKGSDLGKVNDKNFSDVCRDNGLQLGLTKVFLRQTAFSQVERLRVGIVAKAAIKLQTFWRMVSLRRKYLISRGVLQKNDYSRRNKGLAATIIQKMCKKFLRRQRRARNKAAALAAREAQLQAMLDQLREEMQVKIDELQGELKAANIATQAAQEQTVAAQAAADKFRAEAQAMVGERDGLRQLVQGIASSINEKREMVTGNDECPACGK